MCQCMSIPRVLDDSRSNADSRGEVAVEVAGVFEYEL